MVFKEFFDEIVKELNEIDQELNPSKNNRYQIIKTVIKAEKKKPLPPKKRKIRWQ